MFPEHSGLSAPWVQATVVCSTALLLGVQDPVPRVVHGSRTCHVQDISCFSVCPCPLLSCRIVTNLQRTLSERARPSKEMLLQPLPLDMSQATCGKEFKRTLSCATGSGSNSTLAAEQAPSALPALPTGGVPAGPGAPALPAAFPATPTGAARNMQFAHLGFKEHDLRPAVSSSSSPGASRLSGLASSSSSGDGTFSVQKSSSSFSSSSSGSGSAHQLGQLQDIQAAVADYKRPEAAAGLTVSLPNPKLSFTGASGTHVSHLNPAAATVSAAPASPSSNSSAAIAAAGLGPMSPTRSSPSRTSAAGSPLKSGLGLGLKVTLPPETDFELCGSSDSFCFSPNTPGPKPGIKERMKFYFQRQAGAAGGL